MRIPSDRGKHIKSYIMVDVVLTLPITRRDDAEFALETGHEDDDDECADEEDLSTKIAILERLRGRRGRPFEFPLPLWIAWPDILHTRTRAGSRYPFSGMSRGE